MPLRFALLAITLLFGSAVAVAVARAHAVFPASILPSGVSAASKTIVPLSTKGSPKSGWAPYLEVVVGGHATVVILDTGGETSTLPIEFKNRLPVQREIENYDSNGKRKGYIVGPAGLWMNGAEYGSFDFNVHGEYVHLIHGHEKWAASSPMLGLNVLTRYRVRIDGPASHLQLTDDSAPLEGEGWVEYQGFFGSPHLVVAAKDPRGRSLTVFLDTGYALSRICSPFASKPPETLQLRIGSADIRHAVAQVLDAAHDLEIVNNPTGRKMHIHASIGWDILRFHTLEISPRNKKLRLSSTARATSAP